MKITELALEIAEIETPRKWTDKDYWTLTVDKWIDKLTKFIEDNK